MIFFNFRHNAMNISEENQIELENQNNDSFKNFFVERSEILIFISAIFCISILVICIFNNYILGFLIMFLLFLVIFF